MKKALYSLMIASLALWGCGENSEAENEEKQLEEKESAYEQLKKEVMGIHDDVMPESSTIIEYTKTIRESIDSLSEEAKEKSISLMTDLKQADQAMMEWMRQYDDPESLGLSLDSAMVYMQEQKKKIEKVDSLMRNSLKNAKEYIEKTID